MKIHDWIYIWILAIITWIFILATNTPTEEAYKNGYEAAKKDFTPAVEAYTTIIYKDYIQEPPCHFTDGQTYMVGAGCVKSNPPHGE